MRLLYLSGYLLVYPILKNNYRNIKTNFFTKYLLGIDENGDLHKIYISRVSIQSGYELIKYGNRSNFFKMCRAIYGTRKPRTIQFAGIEPNDLIGHYIMYDKDTKSYKKAPSNKMFPVELASRCISFFCSTRNSLVYLDNSLIKTFIKSREIFM